MHSLVQAKSAAAEAVLTAMPSHKDKSVDSTAKGNKYYNVTAAVFTSAPTKVLKADQDLVQTTVEHISVCV